MHRAVHTRYGRQVLQLYKQREWRCRILQGNSTKLEKNSYGWINIAVDGVNFDFIEGCNTFNGVRHIDEEDTHGLEGLLDFNEITEEEFRSKYAVWTKVVEMKKELGISID